MKVFFKKSNTSSTIHAAMNCFGEIQYQYHQVCSKVDTRPTPVQISKPQIRSSANLLKCLQGYGANIKDIYV